MPSSVAIVGGGIAGSVFANHLALLSCRSPNQISIHLFDQGRSGVGGRSSHRVVSQIGSSSAASTGFSLEKAGPSEKRVLHFDHGCQFFRADTSILKQSVARWIADGIVEEWGGEHLGDGDFFGSTKSPLYVPVGGMHMLPRALVDEASAIGILRVFAGVRVEKMRKDETSGKWILVGKTGEAAYHDTKESVARNVSSSTLNNGYQYDIVVLTDISSSFDPWHRAAAGVPRSFAAKVNDRMSARVPLFSCMVAFERSLGLRGKEGAVSSISFNAPEKTVLWYAACNNSKPGCSPNDTDMGNIKADSAVPECWTLVSTPEYALEEIKATPMQDETTGEFIPQPPEYMLRKPAPDLLSAFLLHVKQWKNRRFRQGNPGSGEEEPEALPAVVYLNAQRWGSALPAHRLRHPHDHPSEVGQDLSKPPTRVVIAGVTYDSRRAPLAPTQLVFSGAIGGPGGAGGTKCASSSEAGPAGNSEKETGTHITNSNAGNNVTVASEDSGDTDFIYDAELGIIQCGDMVSRYTPGFESAALSGIAAAEFIFAKVVQQRSVTLSPKTVK